MHKTTRILIALSATFLLIIAARAVFGQQPTLPRPDAVQLRVNAIGEALKAFKPLVNDQCYTNRFVEPGPGFHQGCGEDEDGVYQCFSTFMPERYCCRAMRAAAYALIYTLYSDPDEWDISPPEPQQAPPALPSNRSLRNDA
jgi:hypothetical protein